MRYKLGRKPNDPAKPRLRLGAHLGAVAPPASAMWTGVPVWGVLANDEWGDCTCAGDGHLAEILTFYGQGTEAIITDADALAVYSAISGFNPHAGPPGQNPTDQGAQVQDALGCLRTPGIGGFTIDAFAEVDISDLTAIKTAVSQLGGMSAGVNLPANAQAQFEAGQPWDVTAQDGGIEGGHCIVLCGYDPEYLYFCTWGKIQKATYAWWAKYGEEIWAVVSRDWISTKGSDPEGVNLASLGAEFAQLTGEPDPFATPEAVPPPPAAAVGPLAGFAGLLSDIVAAVRKWWATTGGGQRP